jgi:hypothetical protein
MDIMEQSPGKLQRAKVIQENLFRDSYGYYWAYGAENIRTVGDDDEDGGYRCSSFKEGVELLILYDYVDESDVAAVRLQLEGYR